MNEDYRVFGDRLRAGRQSAGLSQEELAERSGLNVRTIRNLERGRARWPYQDTLRRLADALELREAQRAEFMAAPGRRLALAGASVDAVPLPGVLAEELPNAEAASPVTMPARPGIPGPRQLPAGMRYFTGRKAELDFLTSLLGESESPASAGGTVAISAISGTAGVGKTALAVQWAHQHTELFPDGQLYVNLRGFDPAGPPVPPAEAVRRFLEGLGVPPARIPSDTDAQLGMYRSLLAGRRVLIVLDNARDAGQVRPLLPGTGGCMVLITSRVELTDLVALDGAAPLTVGLLTLDQARELLTRRLGDDRVAREQSHADELISLCGRLPLALNIAAARAITRRRLPLDTLAAELRDTSQRLDLLSAGQGHASVRPVLCWSFQALTEPAARLLRLLSIHPGPDISLPAAASLAGLDCSQVRLVLDELTGAHLVTEHATGRYALHDLQRAYVTELCSAHESPGERRAALRRVLDALLRFLLDAHPDLPCPPETNLPVLCAQLATVWSLIEGAPLAENRGDEPPVIPDAAIAGIRETMDRMLGSYLARRGKKRYCDKSLGSARYAELLQRVYPETKFICLYRHPMDVIASGMEACPWGLNGYGFDPYISTTPGNTVLALARYWADNTAAILAAQERFGDQCVRVRYEDLVTDPEETASQVIAFLGAAAAPGLTGECFSAEREKAGPGDHKIWYTNEISPSSVGRGWSIPAKMIPAQFLDTINELTAKLGYVPVDGEWGTSAPPGDLLLPHDDGAAGAEQHSAEGRAAARRLTAAASDPERSDLLGRRLRANLEQAGPDATARWQPHTGQTAVMVWIPADPDDPAEHWLIDFRNQTVTFTTAAAQEDSDWDVIGSAAAWGQVIAGTLNYSVALRSGQLRYCDNEEAAGPLAGDARIGILAALLGIARW